MSVSIKLSIQFKQQLKLTSVLYLKTIDSNKSFVIEEVWNLRKFYNSSLFEYRFLFQEVKLDEHKLFPSFSTTKLALNCKKTFVSIWLPHSHLKTVLVKNYKICLFKMLMHAAPPGNELILLARLRRATTKWRRFLQRVARLLHREVRKSDRRAW